jgi:hypothetical protein
MVIWLAKIEGKDDHIFLDESNHMNQAEVRIAIYHRLFSQTGDMFNRPLVTLRVLHENEQISIPVVTMRFCQSDNLLKIDSISTR